MMREDQILAQARVAFMEEARDLLGQFESALLSLAGAPDPDCINAAFRAAHTIKGSAGLFGFSEVVGFTHDVEALLDRVRTGELAVSDNMVSLLLECRDHIGGLLDHLDGKQGAQGLSPHLFANSARLGEALRRIGGLGPGGQGRQEPAAAVAIPAQVVEGDDWLLHIRFGLETFQMGFDPASFLRYLPTVGEVVGNEALLGEVPALDLIDPEQCHLSFVLRLRSAAEKAAIEQVFEFVADSISLNMLPPRSKLDQMFALLAGHDDDRTLLGDLLVRIGAVTPRELEAALASHASAQVAGSPPPPPRIGEALVQREAAPPEVVQAAIERQGALRDRRGEESRFVRVAADKLDALISLIGELVIAGSATRILADQRTDAVLAEAAARVCSLVEGARDRALQLRMVPIGDTFSRFKRIVHEVGRSLGKDVELAVSGGDAELDKSMVEQIVDPLTHLVRNALDHGLETPAERTAAGKAPRGQLALNAYHESGSIVIEVSDDGRGLSRERILAKALERGLIAPSVELSDAEVHQLIFLPGFSTAETVTDLSGRGVGMDVVRRNIEALRGEVSLASTAGGGSTVQIRLPLTLAIIDGFRFEVAGHQFVVPLDLVVECIETPAEAAALAQGAHGSCFNLRGEVLPLLCLRRHLSLQGPEAAQRSVVVMRAGGRKLGVLVDRLLGEHQTVIKPMGRLFRKLRGFSGSTILGTGSVALILDIPALVAMADPGSSRVARLPSPSRRSAPAATA